jgi:hypothetical protein
MVEVGMCEGAAVLGACNADLKIGEPRNMTKYVSQHRLG